jgi:hypothetical protein
MAEALITPQNSSIVRARHGGSGYYSDYYQASWLSVPAHRQSVGNVLSVDQPISFPKLEGTALASYPPRLFDGLGVAVAFDVLDRQNVVGGIEYVTPVVRHGRSPLPHLAGSPSRSI